MKIDINFKFPDPTPNHDQLIADLERKLRDLYVELNFLDFKMRRAEAAGFWAPFLLVVIDLVTVSCVTLLYIRMDYSQLKLSLMVVIPLTIFGLFILSVSVKMFLRMKVHGGDLLAELEQQHKVLSAEINATKIELEKLKQNHDITTSS